MTRSATKFIHRLSIVLIALTVLSGCEPDIYGTSSRRSDTQRTVSAAEYARRGDHNSAARAYRKLANESTGVQRDKYLLEAAQQWFAIKQYQNSQRELAAIRTLLDADSQVRKILLQTRVLLELDQPRQALTSINTLDPQNSAEIARPYFGLKGRALFDLGRLSEGTKQFILREGFMRNRAELENNRERLWAELNDKIIAGYREDYESSDSLLAGWISLAEAVSNAPSAHLQKQIIARWSKDYPDHPAKTVALANLVQTDDRYATDGVQPLGEIERIGVLLPLTGRLAQAGEIIRQGIEAANRRRIDPLDVSFHDTDLGTMNAYQKAMAYQVDAIIGPLSKENILELSGRLGETPALVLNRIDGTLGLNGLLQFGLAPEDEAIVAAQYALSEGYTQALTLTPSNEWGDRVLQHFKLAFTAGGGQIMEQANYSTREHDHSTAITGMLNLDESKQRFQRVSYLLGADIEYNPRRRQDVDFIFLAAQTNDGRLIRPQLKFHYASRVPVFATSSIFNADPIRNKDLDGVQVILSEWVIDPVNRDALLALDLNINEENPGNSQLLQLFSLGYDSLNYLMHLSTDTQSPFDGLSGFLIVDEYGVIHRNLPLAEIAGGEIRQTKDVLPEIGFVYDEFGFDLLENGGLDSFDE